MMKRFVSLMLAACFCGAVAVAQDFKTLVVKTTPEVTTEQDGKKLKNQLRLTTGVKKVVARIETKQVTVSYDEKKTSPTEILAAFKKLGYEAQEVNVPQDANGTDVKKKSGKKPVDGVSGASQVN